MLKNKFGMTKVLVLVLSVLMLVSLVACNKADGPSTDDMNAAIQAAIDAANAEQAAKEAALAASIAADKAAQEAKDAAQAESLAKEKAENDAALKKAQEEAAAAAKKAEEASKAAADAAKKAAEEAAKAAEEAAKANEAALKKAQEEAAAAKKAAEEASKAAAEAAAKAQSEADRVASELAAELEAAKAEALKAQEEAAKAQEEASKAIAEASKAAEEAAKASSQLAETTVVPATTPAETTVVAPAETTVAPETTTEAPVVIVDKNDALLKYSELKVKYTITDYNLYLTENAAQIVLLFDKASIDLNNATAEAAASIVATLEIDAAAVPSVKNAAAKVQDLINDLGDIETEVFTVQAEKILEAQEAYAAFKETYKKNLATLNITDANVQEKLGINKAELDLADTKLDVLKAYIQVAFEKDMLEILEKDPKQRYDAEDDTAEDAEIEALIPNAYYKYLILVAINDGNVDAADLPIDWEMKRNANNELVPDYDKPIAWFTAEDLLNVYILPSLDAELTDYAELLYNAFDNATKDDKGLYTTLGKNATIAEVAPSYKAVSYEWNDIYVALRDELLALSYSEDYKGTTTIQKAKADVATRAIKAYIEALNVYFDAAKDVAIKAEEKKAEDAIKAEQRKINGYEKEIAGTDLTHVIAKNENLIAAAEKVIAKTQADLAAFKANVEAATLLTYEELLDKNLQKLTVYKDVFTELNKLTTKGYAVNDVEITLDAVTQKNTKTTKVENFLIAVVANTIDNNFESIVKVNGSAETEVSFAELKKAMIADLEAFRDRLSTNVNNPGDIYDDLKIEWEAYVTNPATPYKNTQLFVDAVTLLNAEIAKVTAVALNTYVDSDSATQNRADKLEDVKTADGKKTYYFKDANALAYAQTVYSYSVINSDSIVAVIEAEEGLVKTDTAGDYPVQYTLTKEQQAIEELAKAYVAAYDAVNKKIVTDANLAKIITNANNLIDKKDSTAYNKLVARSSGTLKAEIEAVGNSYKSEVEKTATTLKNNLKIEAATFYKKSNKISDFTANGTFVTIMTPAEFVAKEYADAYNYKGFEAAAEAKVKEFYKNFYGIDEIDTATTATSTVEQLWAYKLDVTTAIKSTIETYKNTYVAKANGLYDVTAATALGGQYKYGVVGTDVAAATEAVKAYETAIANAAQAAIDNIMAVTLQTETTADIKDGLGTKLVASGTKVNYDMAKAKSIIDAYYNALFGDEAIVVHPNNQASNVTFKAGNSEIFKIYNEKILVNTYGYAKVN